MIEIETSINRILRLRSPGTDTRLGDELVPVAFVGYRAVHLEAVGGTDRVARDHTGLAGGLEQHFVKCSACFVRARKFLLYLGLSDCR